MGVGRRRYDCFLCMTGGVREIVYFFVPVQEMSLFMHVSVALEEAKSFSLAAGMDHFYFFFRHRKRGDLFFCLFLWTRMKGGLSTYLPAVSKRKICVVCTDFKTG